MLKSIYDQEYRELIEKLKHHRKQAGLTQVELASRLGWEQSMISKVETFVRRLDVIEFLKICDVLETTAANLLQKEER